MIPRTEDYSRLVEALGEHGRPSTRAEAKRMVMTFAYSGTLTAIETFLVSQWWEAAAAGDQRGVWWTR